MSTVQTEPAIIVLRAEEAGGRRDYAVSRLARLADLKVESFCKRFELVFLGFHTRDAQPALNNMRKGWRGRKAVLVGDGVFRAFGFAKDPPVVLLQSLEARPGIEVFCIPTLGRGAALWWADEDNVSQVKNLFLRLRIGLVPSTDLAPHPHSERFSHEQMMLALKAGRGSPTWTAKALFEATGQTIAPPAIHNYLKRHPGLRLFAKQQREQLLEVAENNIAKAIEGGDIETSKWLLRSSMAKGRGYEQLIAGRIDGEVTHKHEFTLQIQEAARKLIDAANGVDEVEMIDLAVLRRRHDAANRTHLHGRRRLGLDRLDRSFLRSQPFGLSLGS